MPNGASSARGRQMEMVAGVLHDKETNPRIGELIPTLLSHQGKPRVLLLELFKHSPVANIQRKNATA